MERNSAALTDGKAIPIANICDNRIWLDSHAFGDILNKVGPRPVALVSINGPMRTGKSYIIGHFMRYLSSSENEDWFTKQLTKEFLWKNSVDRQTSGILAWSEPFIVHRNGQEVAIILMDTQGCFDDKTTTHENSLIFTLSCLLSSVLIYNFKNQLSEDILQYLQLFVGYTKLSLDEDQEETFSRLILLIRDWACPKDYEFGYYDDHTNKSGKNFKIDKINVKPEMSKEVKVVRQEIISNFENVGCCLMPYPGNDLACYDNIQNLEPMFVNSIKELIPKVFHGSNITTKKLGGHELTGNDMKQLVEQLAELFEKAETPPVKSVAESRAEVQNQKAYKIAIKYYENEMKSVNSVDGRSEAQFEQLHNKHSLDSIAIFKRAKRINNSEIKDKYFKILCADIHTFYSGYQKIRRIRNEFQQYKAKSEMEKEQLREETEAKIKEIEKESQRNTQNASPFGITLTVLLSIGAILLPLLGIFRR